MTDDEFVDAFLSGKVSAASFHHRDHLRLAWGLIRRSGAEVATSTITAGIQRFATEHGQPTKYHETLTRFWVRVVGYHMEAQPDLATFEHFIAANPRLLEKDLPSHHWRRETMRSDAARVAWVEPDLLVLPA